VAIKIKTKTKPKQISRSAIKSIDDKAYGPEPIQIKDFTDALNWYNYMSDDEKSRDWFFTYVKKHYTKNEVAALRKLPKWKISKTLGSVARILTNGNKLPQNNMDYFDRSVKDLVKLASSTIEEVETKEKPKTTITIQDRVQAKIHNLITDCEEAIDTISNFNVYNWLVAKEVTPQAANAIREYYSKFAADHEPDEHDTPAMKKSRAQLKKHWGEFVLLIDRYINNKKAVKVRKPREKKVKSAVELVKNLKFRKEDPSLKIVSVHPAEIIGCQQLWVYNTKYRKLIQYQAVGPAGIQVKGTTVTGWDTESSTSKTLRKPEEALTGLLSAGKVTLRSFMSNIKTTESKPNGRINSECILVRVIK
jgi:hypothetical protein